MTGETIKKPNFFIIGAPKCGTTSMAHYLSTHPDIFFCSPKEPQFFATDTPTEYNLRYKTEAEYLKLFQDAGNAKCIGEGSVRYLRSRVAVPSILRFNPDAKFIVMLRNPVDMAASWHSQQIKSLRENQLDFIKAWRLQAERRAGRCIPRSCGWPDALQYGDVCAVGTQLERLYTHVPRERVHVIFFDDLVRDVLGTYQKTLAFLGVPYDSRTSFETENSHRTPRVFWLRYIFSPYVRVRMQYLRRILGKWILPSSFQLGVTSALDTLFYRKEKRRPMSPEFRRELVAYFEPEIRKLEALTQRDLSGWSA